MKKLPIGTRVFDITKGWGEVVEYKNPCVAYESNMVVKFNSGGIYTYTLKGKYNSLDETPLLSLTEYNLTEGGFTSVTDFDKPEIGDFGYFWDSEDKDLVVLSKLIFIDNSSCLKYRINMNSTGGFFNFSKEIPQWFADRMNK